ncbi:MAG: hypothetical protein Q8L14_16735 [Myxococcales bacterium]|nr:hypothetical protein [Myxococcales bacterium]
MSRYFKIKDDLRERWFLGDAVDADGVEIDSNCFHILSPRPPMTFPVKHPGRPVAFTMGPFDLPVLRRDLAEKIANLAGSHVRLVDALIEGHAGEYSVLRVELADVMDLNLSKLRRWVPADGVPELVGEVEDVEKLVLDPVKVAGLHCFRVKEWEVVLVVSEQAAQALSGCSGIKLVELPLGPIGRA